MSENEKLLNFPFFHFIRAFSPLGTLQVKMSFKNKLRCVVWRRVNKKIAATAAVYKEGFEQARKVQKSTSKRNFLLRDTGRCSASERYFLSSATGSHRLITTILSTTLSSTDYGVPSAKLEGSPSKLRSIIQHCSFYGRILIIKINKKD